MSDQPVDSELWMSITELAAVKGVSKQAVSKRVARLVAGGAIDVHKQDGETRVNIVAYNRAISDHTDPAQALRNPGLKLEPSTSGSLAAAQAEIADAPKSKGYLAHKETSAAYQAENDRLDLEERLGKLCDRADVEHRTFNIFRRLRDRLMGLPAICAARVVHASEERAVRAILDEEVRIMLTRLARDLDQADAAGDVADDVNDERELSGGVAAEQ